MKRRSLGSGRSARFVDNERVEVLLPDSNRRELIDLRTDERTAAPAPRPEPMDRLVQGSYELQRAPSRERPLEHRFELRETDSERLLLDFAAYDARWAGADELVVATAPEVKVGTSQDPPTTNIFVVDIGTGKASFIATVDFAPFGWSLAANRDYVLWTSDLCGPRQARTFLHDRRNGALTEIDSGLAGARFTPGGLIASGGSIGAKGLIDPATLTYTAQLRGVVDAVWTSDYQYAATGQFGGHGGHCA
jgi:hypothetical protein